MSYYYGYDKSLKSQFSLRDEMISCFKGTKKGDERIKQYTARARWGYSGEKYGNKYWKIEISKYEYTTMKHPDFVNHDRSDVCIQFIKGNTYSHTVYAAYKSGYVYAAQWNENMPELITKYVPKSYDATKMTFQKFKKMIIEWLGQDAYDDGFITNAVMKKGNLPEPRVLTDDIVLTRGVMPRYYTNQAGEHARKTVPYVKFRNLVAYASVTGLVSIDSKGYTTLDAAEKPGNDAWFLINCQDATGTTYEVIYNGEHLHFVQKAQKNKKASMRVIRRNKKLEGRGNKQVSFNKIDKLVLDEVIKDYCKSI